MKPLGSLVASEINFGEELLATGKKERVGNQGALFEQILVIANCRNNIVDDVLRDCHRIRHG
jgi:hypothetical protein